MIKNHQNFLLILDKKYSNFHVGEVLSLVVRGKREDPPSFPPQGGEKREK
jgi:hypothetical protein